MPEVRDTVVVGGGLSGLLVARELIRAGESVTLLERGSARLDNDKRPYGRREERLPSTEHNTETPPGEAVHGWQYAYALGGSSLLWAGVAPRLLPSDFELRSRFGIGRDWPIGYSDLVPFYKDAERALEVSGRPHPIFPDSDAYEAEPPPPSAADELLKPLLEPFGTLPLARRHYGSFGQGLAEAASGPAEDSNWTAMPIARELAAAAGFELRGKTAAARLRAESERVTAIECVAGDGAKTEVRANRVVLACHGIENAALLLRSGLPSPALGRWLGDHTHVRLEIELEQPIEHWGGTRDSGISYAWADGPSRSERSGAIVIPYNHGLSLRLELTQALSRGESGPAMRDRLRQRFANTLVLYASLEDPPREDRFVELSPKRDGLGLPLSRVHYPPDSDYVGRGLDHVCTELEERLAPLGGRIVHRDFGGLGGHLLGTCFMGPEGVVDENLRHHRFANLYVTGGSAFPTHSPMHPTMTIAALAVRLGKHLAQC